MKIVFIVYHDILGDRITQLFEDLKIDYFTEWENVKGKGHFSDAHLGTRTFPGYNVVRMIAFQEEKVLEELIAGVTRLNDEITRHDDKIRIFQLPLEKIL
ncbi:MAG: hypothetical protein P4L45_05395 [Ignavibacteriaceae bacterium]|nr:hypothetical protein [Ignavibacteriaceae bacterium]